MSVSLLEVIEHGGYNLSTKEDALWLLSKQSEFEELVEKAEEIIEDEQMEALSNCCDAVMISEPYDGLARCGFCFEMAEFTTVEELTA